MKRWIIPPLILLTALLVFSRATATQSSVNLSTAASFAVLGGQTVTNTGPSIVSGDLGVSPGSAVTGFPPGRVVGAIHAADEMAAQAQADLTAAYDDAAGRTPATTVSGDLGGRTLSPGVYKSASGLSLTGAVVLDGENDPNAVFIFQAGSTLVTGTASVIQLVRGAQPCNVFWQVGSSATLGTHSAFVGTIMAITSASVQTGATVEGRVLARNGQVSLDDNRITRPTCASVAQPTTTTSSEEAPPPTTTTTNVRTPPTTRDIATTTSTTVLEPPVVTTPPPEPSELPRTH